MNKKTVICEIYYRFNIFLAVSHNENENIILVFEYIYHVLEPPPSLILQFLDTGTKPLFTRRKLKQRV